MSKNLRLVVTVSNLRGISYAVDRLGNNFEERIGYHADQVVVSANGHSASGTAHVLRYPDEPVENWKALQTAAMATGAFPVALRARIVRKTAVDALAPILTGASNRLCGKMIVSGLRRRGAALILPLANQYLLVAQSFGRIEP